MLDNRKATLHLLDRLADMLLNSAVAAFVGSIFAPQYLLLSLIVAIVALCFGAAIHYIIGGLK